jgi:hypothetical protein
MTQQLRTGYRKHRKATWGVVLLLVLAAGAIFIPLASGAGGKTYTLTLNPASQCASSTDGTTSTVLTLTDTSRTQGLGSAELLFPAGSVFSTSLGTFASSQTGTPYDAGTTADVIGPLNNLGLSPGGSVNITVTFKAGAHTGPVEAVVKQANNFNDSSGSANLFDNPPTWPQLNVTTCHYAFTQQPVDTQTGAAQTVKVQLQSGTTPVAVTGSLSLTAVQNGTPGTPGTPGTSVSSFTGLTSSGQDATKTWVFNSVTGTQSGNNFELVAGAGSDAQTVSSSFNIVDCNPTGGSCTTPLIVNGDGSGAGQVSGTGVASGFNISLGGLPASAAGICSNGWGWQQMTFPAQPPDGRTTFDGITTTSTSYSSSSGFLKVTLYFRNDLYVQTSASQTNSIQICAGVQHSSMLNDGRYPWTGANATSAQFDTSSDEGGGFYWGVLQRIANCNSNKIPVNSVNGPDGVKSIKSPALCAWGTVAINGIDYRSATVIVPSDWDYKGGG